MIKDRIVFNGKEYITRDVWLPDYKVTVKVSTEDLDAAVFDVDNGYSSREAELIDELIFFYVPEDMIGTSDEELAEYIEEKVYE